MTERALSDEQANQAFEMADKGISSREIARRLERQHKIDVSHSAVLAAVRRVGRDHEETLTAVQDEHPKTPGGSDLEQFTQAMTQLRYLRRRAMCAPMDRLKVVE